MMDQAGESAHGATSPCNKPGVSEVLGTLPKLAIAASDVLGSKSRYDVVLADTFVSRHLISGPHSAFSDDRR
jgi:hypothetical protein